ncbi:MAG: hypothetical protein GXZ12_00265 [Clostridiaceae bacterium]|jgi:hypothetical protein|nr:hypothetical protein [Clostridiaceae bacterium]
MGKLKSITLSILICTVVSVCFLLGRNSVTSDSIESGKDSVINILEGTWESIDSNKYQGTTLWIKIIDETSFEFELYAFWSDGQGSANIGLCSGKGYIKDDLIALEIENGAAKGKIALRENVIHIEYQGDMSQFAGLNVIFSTDFKKIK